MPSAAHVLAVAALAVVGKHGLARNFESNGAAGASSCVSLAHVLTFCHKFLQVTQCKFPLLADHFEQALAGYEMKSSMSRKGDCWANAPTKHLWGRLKVGRRFATAVRPWTR